MGKKKTKGLVCMQYLHRVDVDFFSTTCQVQTHLFVPLHYPPPAHGSQFCKLRTFDIIEFFFLYGPPTLKTLCHLTSFCYCKASLRSHKPEKQTQKGKKKEDTRRDKKKKQRNKKQETKKWKKKQYRWKQEEIRK